MTDWVDAQQVAAYLHAHPEFFNDQPELLRVLTLPHPVGGHAVSLVERQIDVLRERHKSLERRLAEWLRAAHDHQALDATVHQWTLDLLRARAAEALPGLIERGLKQAFAVPQVVLRLWRVAGMARPSDWVVPIDAAVMTATTALAQPYCGPVPAWAPVQWLSTQGAQTRCVAILPLRAVPGADPFGLLLLGSPDPNRFTSEMGVEMLARMADAAAAALSRLLDGTQPT